MTMPEKEDRFTVRYQVTVREGGKIEQIARDIAVEQTVEIPFDCIPDEHIRRGIIGKIEYIRQLKQDKPRYEVHISYPSAVTGREVPQFLNVLFGNISLKSNIQIKDFSYPHDPRLFPGPTSGIPGIRKRLGVYSRPLTCTALKPLGLSTEELARLAGEFAAGGVDFIKDDHGLSDQQYHPFRERVARCQEAVTRGNALNGGNTIYSPMVSGSFDRIMQQVEYALSCGVRAILMAPMLVGMDTVRYVAQTYGPIILAHPSFTGTHFHDRDHGMTPAVLLGKLFRLIGADVSIFPNAGGRFGFTQEDCARLASALRGPMHNVKPAFPCPAGGMQLKKIDSIIQQFGPDTMLLIGGSILQHPHGVIEGTKAFVDAVSRLFPEEATADTQSNMWQAPSACELPAAGINQNKHVSELLRNDSFRWSDRSVDLYKTDTTVNFKGISRQNLFGIFGEKTSFELRYFEIEPGGYSSLERHAHEHVIIGARGEGIIRKGDNDYTVSVHDIAYVKPHEVHQLRNNTEQPFGFYCIVDRTRDRPVALD